MPVVLKYAESASFREKYVLISLLISDYIVYAIKI